MPTFAITGASGQLGRIVTQELLDRGVAATDLVLITRTPDALSDRAAVGVQVRAGDFADERGLAAAFDGVDRLLIISTDAIGARLEGQRAAVRAAADARVGRIVYTSASNPVAENPVAVGADHRGTEEAVQVSGVPFTILRNALYAEFEIPGVQGAIASGQFVTNRGEGRTTFVSRNDCAAAAAGALLADTDGSVTYDVTGSELLSAADEAALIAELAGRPVEVVHVDDDAYIAGLQEHGVPELIATVSASFGRAIREGYLDQRSDAVQQLAGRPPRGLRDVVAAAL